MDRQDDFYRKVGDLEREQQKKARKEKWEKRGKSFWKSFLLTEDGKPKSGLMTYTFCLSVVYILLYLGGFYLTIRFLSAPLSGLPAVWGNLLQSVLVGLAGMLVSWVLHRVFSDKRLAFRTHLWLVAYVVACVIVLVILLWGDGAAIWAMLHFALWFAVIPVTMGFVLTLALYRRDHVPEEEREQPPAWKQYTDRR